MMLEPHAFSVRLSRPMGDRCQVAPDFIVARRPRQEHPGGGQLSLRIPLIVGRLMGCEGVLEGPKKLRVVATPGLSSWEPGPEMTLRPAGTAGGKDLAPNGSQRLVEGKPGLWMP